MKKLTNFLLVFILLTGISLILYPTVSDWWNAGHQTRAVASYVEKVADLSIGEQEKLYEQAIAYNERLFANGQQFLLSDEEREEYNGELDITGTGIMGYVEIEKIDQKLPIYHGTEDTVLQVAVGHIEGTSLPVGGESTHCVISGHSGLPSARLFTDIGILEEGDRFVITVLSHTLTYEVDQIRIVLPEELEDLKIEEGKDFCTLVTCTPYGVNSHRLLVRGHRIENDAEAIIVTADALQMDPNLVALFIGFVLAVICLLLFGRGGRRKAK